MQKCAELSRLPKASAVKSVNFRRTTPGTIGPLLYYGGKNLDRVDPTHPASSYAPVYIKKAMPSWTQPGFVLRAYPKGAMFRPEILWPNPPYHPAGRHHNRINMSLVTVIKRDGLFKHQVYRRAVACKIKEAISLIVARGAHVRTDRKGKETVRLSDEPQRDLILEDWTYAIAPNPTTHRMLYPELIRTLRFALARISDQARKFEVRWNLEEEGLPTRQPFAEPRDLDDAGSLRSQAQTKELAKTEFKRAKRGVLTEGETAADEVDDQAEDVMDLLRKALPPALLEDAADILDELPGFDRMQGAGVLRTDADADDSSLVDWRVLAAKARKAVDIDADKREETAALQWAFRNRLPSRVASELPRSSWAERLEDSGVEVKEGSRPEEQGDSNETDWDIDVADDSRKAVDSQLTEDSAFWESFTQSKSGPPKTDEKPDVLQRLFSQKRIFRVPPSNKDKKS